MVKVEVRLRFRRSGVTVDVEGGVRRLARWSPKREVIGFRFFFGEKVEGTKEEGRETRARRDASVLRGE